MSLKNPFSEALAKQAFGPLFTKQPGKPRPRYYYTRTKSASRGAAVMTNDVWHVKDRQIHDMIICKCFYKEAAHLIVQALNQSLEPKAVPNVNVSAAECTSARAAILADLYPEPSTWIRDSDRFPEFFDSSHLGRAVPSPRR